MEIILFKTVYFSDDKLFPLQLLLNIRNKALKPLANSISVVKESIFSTMTSLAGQYNAINLSQGFPDFDGPNWIKDLAQEAISNGKNQYAPSAGIIELRETISDNFQQFYQLKYDPSSEITITNGATEAIFCSILSLINPGDEVIVFEPFYDSYHVAVKIAGGITIPVTLHHDDFNYSREELKNAFSKKTKLIILNSPHNPSGKVFSKEELEFIGDLACIHDCYILSDEVYEFLTFEHFQHIPIASLKDFFKRTITVSSSGKTFGLTGWKIGWAAAPKSLSRAIRTIHSYNTFSVCHPMQHAISLALKKLPDYLPEFKRSYQEKRDLFVSGIKKIGLNPINPQGTYFTMCFIGDYSQKSDIDYCLSLIKSCNVAAIPSSPFYLKSDEGSKLIRFCFAKTKETIKASLAHLQNFHLAN